MSKRISKEGFEESLYERARDGDVALLDRPDVGKRKDKWHWTLLHYLASSSCREVLRHPDVAIARDGNGRTPLHILAAAGVEETLLHPQVATVADNLGKTPLHELAARGCMGVFRHPKAKTKVGGYFLTPFALLSQALERRLKDLQHEIESYEQRTSNGMGMTDHLLAAEFSTLSVAKSRR